MIEFNEHLEKDFMAIPNRIHRKINRYSKWSRIKRKDRLILERDIINYAKCLADDFEVKLNNLISKDNLNDDEFYNLLAISKNSPDDELKNLVVGICPNNHDDKLKNIILSVTSLYMIENKGMYLGPAYALIFNRAYDMELDYVMQYGYSEDEKGEALLKEYLNHGGCECIMCVPNYFKNVKFKYSIEELDKLINAKKMLKEFKRSF